MVRISQNDFWGNYDSHKDVLLRCFKAIKHTSFRSDEPEEADFHYLLIALKHQKIFEKYDTKRQKKVTVCAERAFENYLYQRIWAILWNLYNERKKYSSRFRTGKFLLTNLHQRTYSTPETLYADDVPDNEVEFRLHWKDRNKGKKYQEERRQERIAKLRHTRESRAKRCPTIHDVPPAHFDKGYNAEDNLIEHETMEILYSFCSNEDERRIIKFRELGYSNPQIAECLNTTQAVVSGFLRRLKKKYIARITAPALQQA